MEGLSGSGRGWGLGAGGWGLGWERQNTRRVSRTCKEYPAGHGSVGNAQPMRELQELDP